ncbi:hypothetical protein MJO28_002477 [Puccinia striiformis f. sp. tritici]|uniref:Uncharacterized protein n=4 Tax=Puccinia striiformis TaxID=27350 RepID=A0A0L0VLI0_9BASI|nr:hypothetical protein Pst134EA_005550 [Puccinia striiformis f. sp. tritici]KAI9618838.1 hypothetical protein H4Q26_012092 [Puccinia striiformis f. sp. tritici PST-130]KNF00143.1 hypothetical protein PSTG_06553 [Puccinia striiformis f. sp. tritici PST-78]POW07198.1 hypothetical protein PSTT_08451 [Puccinia striiformis]KAH9462752.1 hypothetical protein Pst134EB_006628 [Puccinia striiformis f. sp. tritici]KAH9471671.1 hypothetical protein Pst134EA_005550 [Puccinia striiformis f. sp. tritici]
MESLLSPPLNIQLVETSPAKSYEEVQESLSTCLDDHDLLPYVIGGNTFQIKNHLYKIRDEVNFLQNRRPSSSSKQHSNKKRKTQDRTPSKRAQKSKPSSTHLGGS